MNADQGDMTLDSPEALRLKTSGFAAVASISTPMSVDDSIAGVVTHESGLTRRHLVADDLTGLERDDAALDDAFAVLAAGVDHGRSAE
jgi:hypothetical protein